jgi:ATP-dependent RNA helicase DeaD
VKGDQVEQDGRDVPAAGVARSSNTVFVMAHDWASTAQFLAPSLQRVDDAQRDVQLLIVTPDAEVAAAAAATAVKLTEGRDIGIVAATSVRRAARIIKTQPAQVIAGSADTLVELLKGAALKLDTVRMVCIAWADELVALGALPSLEALMTEVPKESARTVVTTELTPEVEALLERYARRARRVVSPSSEADEPIDLEYVSVAPQTRLSTLRRVLDEVDPASSVIFVRDGESTVDVRGLLDSLGYRAGDAAIRTGMAAAPGTELVVLFDLPASREELREAAGSASRRIALVQPRQLASLRLLTAGGSTKPLTLGEAAGRARSRDESLRAELRGVLAEGHFGRELLALEALLDEFDGAEIAAAAVQLLERERVARAKQATAPTAEPRERVEAGMTRLFMTIGSRDNARPGDIVGAIANTAGISSAQIGKIDLRESHSTIEVANDVADTVIERVTGTSIKGRRVVIRREKRDAAGGGREMPGRGERREPRGDRRESRREPRGDRREPRGDRREPRGERRPARGPRFGDRE